MKLQNSSRILITGAAGQVGQALSARLKASYSNVFPLTRQECDLEDLSQTLKVFREIKPEFVFHLAARVGGIQANINDPVGFLQSNLLINTHTLQACREVDVKRFLFLGSSCIYPRECPQPMREEYLLTGPLEPTNEGYALSKITGIRLAQYYQKQFGLEVVCPIPPNIYGPSDTFDLDRTHVLSALVRRFVTAQEQNAPTLTLWGTGTARREFLYIDDLVEGLLFFMNNVTTPETLNLGTGQDISIKELAELIARLVGYEGKILWDATRPDGMPRKLMDSAKIEKLGFKAKTKFEDGVKAIIQAYREIRQRGEWQ